MAGPILLILILKHLWANLNGQKIWNNCEKGMDEELNITFTEFGESFFIGNNLLQGQFDESLFRLGVK